MRGMLSTTNGSGCFTTGLLIERMDAETLTQLEFNPRWVRVEPGATPRDPVKLVSRGQSVTVGIHLAQHRRKQFAVELRMWLQCAENARMSVRSAVEEKKQ